MPDDDFAEAVMIAQAEFDTHRPQVVAGLSRGGAVAMNIDGGGAKMVLGDAYYLRTELTADDHPVSALAAQRADDDGRRRASLEHLRSLVRDHGNEVDVIGYHDLTEVSADYALPR